MDVYVGAHVDVDLCRSRSRCRYTYRCRNHLDVDTYVDVDVHIDVEVNLRALLVRANARASNACSSNAVDADAYVAVDFVCCWTPRENGIQRAPAELDRQGQK